MNQRQKWVCWGALALFCVTVLTVPVVTFNGTWSGNHAVGGLRRIPFWAVSVSQKIRMDILLVEWVAIAVIAGALFFLLRGVIVKESRILSVEEIKLKKIRRTQIICIGAAAILAFALLIFYLQEQEKQRKDEQAMRGLATMAASLPQPTKAAKTNVFDQFDEKPSKASTQSDQ